MRFQTRTRALGAARKRPQASLHDETEHEVLAAFDNVIVHEDRFVEEPLKRNAVNDGNDDARGVTGIHGLEFARIDALLNDRCGGGAELVVVPSHGLTDFFLLVDLGPEVHIDAVIFAFVSHHAKALAHNLPQALFRVFRTIGNVGKKGLDISRHTVEHRHHQIFLIQEVVMDDALRNVGDTGDVLHREVVVAIARDTFDRRVDDLAFSFDRKVGFTHGEILALSRLGSGLRDDEGGGRRDPLANRARPLGRQSPSRPGRPGAIRRGKSPYSRLEGNSGPSRVPYGIPNQDEGRLVYDLLHLMYQDGFLSSTELTALRKTCRDLRENPVRVLRSLNIVSQPEIQGLLQRFYGHDAVTEELVENIGDEQRNLMPVDLALHYNTVGIAEEGHDLFVMLEDPTEKRALESLGFFLGKRIRPVVATASQLARSLAKVYGVEVADLRLTTVLEASRGVAGGVVYDTSQIRTATRDDEGFLVDQGARMGTLDSALGRKNNGRPPVGSVEVAKAVTALPALPVLKAAAEPFGDDSGSDELGARIAQSLSKDIASHPVGDFSTPAPLEAVAPVVVAPDPTNPTRSVFDDFEGMEFVESIDDSVAASNDAFLATAEDSSFSEVEETSPLTEEEGDALSELSLDGDFDPDSEGADGTDGAQGSQGAEVVPSPVSAPVALISAAAVSKALVKVALVRTREEALVKANGLLAEEGVEIQRDAEGRLSVRCNDATHDVADVNALARLPASFEPLRPLLKQIFRLRAVG